MSKLKPTRQKAFEERVKNNIRALGNRHGLHYDKAIAEKANISPSTFYKKMGDPRTLRLDDLFQIAEAFKEPAAVLFKE